MNQAYTKLFFKWRSLENDKKLFLMTDLGLIAAKSILRFSEASKGDEKSEYVLTGTLLSLAIALCLGIIVLKMHL